MPEVGRRCFVAYVGAVLLLLGFVNARVSYYQQYGIAPYDLALLALAFVLGVVLAALAFKARSRLGRWLSAPGRYLAFVLAGSALLLAAQAAVIAGAWFETGWDVGILANVGERPSQSEYFSTYPNQWLLAGFFVLVGKLTSVSGPDLYLALVIVGALGVTASVALTAYIGRALGGPLVGACAFAVAWALLGLNPNILVPYSDTYGMLCPTVVLFVYTTVRSRCAKWALIPFFSYVGYCIKPTAIFAVAAIVAVEGCFALSRLASREGRKGPSRIEDARCGRPAGRGVRAASPRRTAKDGSALQDGQPQHARPARKFGPKQWALCAACGALSLAVAFALAAFLERQSDITVDENRAFGAAHYLMMGFNEEYNGVYSSDDYQFTYGFETVDERTKANLEAWRDRVVGLGPLGVGKLFAEKAMLSYGEGAFTWRDWYFENVYGKNAAVRWAYGIPEESQTPSKLAPDDVAPWAWPAQVLWFMALVGIVLTASGKARAGKKESAVCLALFMLSVFLLLFECRARYLFLFAPWFVVLGVLGWKRAALAAQALFSKRRGKTGRSPRLRRA